MARQVDIKLVHRYDRNCLVGPMVNGRLAVDLNVGYFFLLKRLSVEIMVQNRHHAQLFFTGVVQLLKLLQLLGSRLWEHVAHRLNLLRHFFRAFQRRLFYLGSLLLYVLQCL